ncbi:MAG: 3'(2'),5'-bisphosphate nucleotidase [Deltaproteobacteria bacterium]|nr:MAG: 3'(2'),5'-bisphosphate nucleotidase [Deltaproteobacteria bacterium]
MTGERDVAVAAVRDALRLVAGVRPGDAHEKRDRSPVTVADFGSQAVVCRALAEAFPDDPVIAEESADALRASGLADRVVAEVARVCGPTDVDTVCTWIDRGRSTAYAPRFWTLDPIDGTKGFLRGDHYAVALALVVDGEPAVAALGCPGLGIIASCAPGEPASAEPIAGGPRAPIAASGVADPRDARVCESVEAAHSAHDVHAAIAERLGVRAAPVRMDSQAKYAAVARGDADVYLRLPTRADYVERIWDHAAGAAIVRAAGGRVTDIDGRELDFTCGALLARNRGIVATNGRLHDAVLAAARAALA